MKSRTWSTGMLLTLMGTVLGVAGAAGTWMVKLPESPAGIPPVVAIPQKVAGFGLKLGWLKVGWAVVICAVACSALMLIPQPLADPRLSRGVHVALAGSILALAVLHTGLYPGVILSASGGLLLL